MKSATPIAIHIPHASRRIPHDIRGAILLSDSELEEELAKVTDTYTDELFKIDAAGAQTVIFPEGLRTVLLSCVTEKRGPYIRL